ncbi:hypothetical protein Pmani_026668 [Petrolisthes manimaculis]|uniref:Uncharacterized protein n=1 Tax=Petrolisthes manimaculis TaxID=1843537 RepID=A0AAE1TZW3_9EUCA|nr:hypothetical protein Pmani_026668 [Petrolisthes manimaculis]
MVQDLRKFSLPAGEGKGEGGGVHAGGQRTVLREEMKNNGGGGGGGDGGDDEMVVEMEGRTLLPILLYQSHIRQTHSRQTT